MMQDDGCSQRKPPPEKTEHLSKIAKLSSDDSCNQNRPAPDKKELQDDSSNQNRPAPDKKEHFSEIAKRAIKAGQKSVLTHFCNEIATETNKTENKRIPYGIVSQILRDAKPHYPWISRDMITNEYRRRQAREKNPNTSTTEDGSNSVTYSRRGTPKVETKEEKIIRKQAQRAAKNEITERVKEEMNKPTNRQRLTKGLLQRIIKQVKRKHNLPSDFNVPHCTIHRRINRQNRNITKQQAKIKQKKTEEETIPLETENDDPKTPARKARKAELYARNAESKDRTPLRGAEEEVVQEVDEGGVAAPSPVGSGEVNDRVDEISYVVQL